MVTTKHKHNQVGFVLFAICIILIFKRQTLLFHVEGEQPYLHTRLCTLYVQMQYLYICYSVIYLAYC